MLRVASTIDDPVYARHILGLTAGTSEQPAGGHLRVTPPAPRTGRRTLRADPIAGHDVWVRRHADAFDLYHLHLSAPGVAPRSLMRLQDQLGRRGRPLVATLHDLRGLEGPDPGAFEESLDLIARSADRLITLTPGAAAQIRERWDREATVIPHPHVVPLEHLERRRPARRRPVVGMDLHRLPPHLEPMPMLEVLVGAVRRHAAAGRAMDVRIGVHADVLTAGSPLHDADVAARLRRLSGRGRLTLDVDHSRAGSESTSRVWEQLRRLDLCVLPFRFGSHSRWVEACHDVGTRVLTPTLGFFSQQRPGVLTFAREPDGTPSAADVGATLEHVWDEVTSGVSWHATRLHRTAQRQRIAHQHEELYREVLAR